MPRGLAERKLLMVLHPEEMKLLRLDYGDLIRPAFRILPDSGWAQCTNNTEGILMVYGPKHRDEYSVFDTSPYILPPGATTPTNWDCKGFLVPSDRSLRCWWRRRQGPLAIKFWNFRRFWVRNVDAETYESSINNGVFEPSQINWAIPNLAYNQIQDRVGSELR
jgi:hypothetical protein